MTFYDRESELDALETALASPGHEFYVVYGRRRVGKTELLTEFCGDRPHIYFLAAQEAEYRQREKFIEKIADHFDDRVPRVDGWDEAFTYLGEKLATEKRIVCIDEFPYLVDENGSLLSYSLVSQLREKAEGVRWGPDTRDEEFALFSRSGFVDGLDEALDDHWSLFDLTAIEDCLSSPP